MFFLGEKANIQKGHADQAKHAAEVAKQESEQAKAAAEVSIFQILFKLFQILNNEFSKIWSNLDFCENFEILNFVKFEHAKQENSKIAQEMAAQILKERQELTELREQISKKQNETQEDFEKKISVVEIMKNKFEAEKEQKTQELTDAKQALEKKSQELIQEKIHLESSVTAAKNQTRIEQQKVEAAQESLKQAELDRISAEKLAKKAKETAEDLKQVKKNFFKILVIWANFVLGLRIRNFQILGLRITNFTKIQNLQKSPNFVQK